MTDTPRPDTANDDSLPACDDLMDRIFRAGRRAAPRIVWSAFLAGEDVRGALDLAWSLAEFPEDDLGKDRWLTLFSSRGTPTAARDTIVYRGAAPGGVRRMAWTTNADVALWFARGANFRERGEVWQAHVAREGVLALINERGESEVVVDPAQLDSLRRVE